MALSGKERNSLGGGALLEGLEGGVGSEDLEPHHTFCFLFFSSQLLCGDGNGSCQSVAPGTRLSLPVTMPPPRPDGLCHFGTASPINPFFVRLLVSRPHGLRPITKHFPPPAPASSSYPPSEPSADASVPPGCSPLRICIQSFWPFLPLIFLKFQLSASP